MGSKYRFASRVCMFSHAAILHSLWQAYCHVICHVISVVCRIDHVAQKQKEHIHIYYDKDGMLCRQYDYPYLPG